MIEVQKVFTVTKPIGFVQEYLKDFANAAEWDPGTKSCTRQGSGPVQVGATWRNVSEFKGKETELTYELTDSSPRHLQFVGTNKTVTSTDDITMATVDGGTSITYHAEFEFHGIAKLASPFLKGDLEELADKTATQMAQVIDSK